jgi:4-hydroxyphenylpyruvate dioxygenase
LHRSATTASQDSGGAAAVPYIPVEQGRPREARPSRKEPAMSVAHDLKETKDLWENPLGLNGFEFVEYTAEDPALLGPLFEQLGFTKIAVHRSKKHVELWRQNDVNFIVNLEPNSRAKRFAKEHKAGANAMAFRVADAKAAFDALVEKGANPVSDPVGPMELNIPAIEGIGGSLIYLIDTKGPSIYDVDFEYLPGVDKHPKGAGLELVDHLTHNVYRGRMDYWGKFYEDLFNFKEIRYFDIEGKLTGLKSRAMTAPDGKIRIPINESSDDKSQIEEYLMDFRGEGIQHIALLTENIYETVDKLSQLGVAFMTPPPDTYYEMLDERVPGHGEPIDELKKRGLLVDGSPDGKILLQIFTETVIGPVFFEIIQRKGDDGFGEGNFKALFESMERDQIRRGVLEDTSESQ